MSVPWLFVAPVAALALALLVVAARERSVRARGRELEERDHRLTRVEASLNLLESRAAELRSEIASLERQRDELVVVLPEAERSELLRAQLSDKAGAGGPSRRTSTR